VHINNVPGLQVQKAVMAGNSTKAYLVNASGKKAGKSLLRYCRKCEFD